MAELFRWWVPGDLEFHGTAYVFEDEWDARSVSSDITFAKTVFRNFYDNGQLAGDVAASFRSRDDDLPRPDLGG